MYFKKIEYIDTLRVMAMIAVIMNHSFGYFSCDNWVRYSGTKIQICDMILNAFTRFNVPVFIMISGVLQLSDRRNEDIRYIFKVRIRNIIIPFIMWTFLYVFVNCLLLNKGGGYTR